MSDQIDVEQIKEEVETRIKRVETLKEEYKAKYEEMKDIEKQVTIEAGAISALQSIMQTQEQSEGDDK